MVEKYQEVKLAIIAPQFWQEKARHGTSDMLKQILYTFAVICILHTDKFTCCVRQLQLRRLRQTISTENQKCFKQPAKRHLMLTFACT